MPFVGTFETVFSYLCSCKNLRFVFFSELPIFLLSFFRNSRKTCFDFILRVLTQYTRNNKKSNFKISAKSQKQNSKSERVKRSRFRLRRKYSKFYVRKLVCCCSLYLITLQNGEIFSPFSQSVWNFVQRLGCDTGLTPLFNLNSPDLKAS